MRASIALYALALALIPVTGIVAHPHTYIDAELGIDIGPRGVQGLFFRWAPQRNFCTELLACDSNEDGLFDADETQDLRVDAFEAIARYHHFIHIDIDGVSYRIQAVEDFTVQRGGDQVYFSFYVPCHIAASTEDSHLTVSMRDESSYVSFALRYVDDGMDDAILSSLEIIRDGNVYSHGSDFGNQDVRLSFSLADKDSNRDTGLAIVSGLTLESELDHVPTETHANPFYRLGFEPRVDLQEGGNPFFTRP